MTEFHIMIAFILFALWICALVYHLRRVDLPDTERIVWTIVLCCLNVLGVVLYFCMVPAPPQEQPLSEADLKAKFNGDSD